MEDNLCEICKYHSPIPKSFEIHHILPIKWGGENKEENHITLCPTSHRNTHVILDQIHDINNPGKEKRDWEVPDWNFMKYFGERERHLALEGLILAQENELEESENEEDEQDSAE